MLPKHISEDMGPGAVPHAADQQHHDSKRANVLRSLYLYDDLFNDIDNHHPEGDVRHRFQGLRFIRANYNEAKVFHWNRKRIELNEAIKARVQDPEDAAVQDRYEEIMEALYKYLDRSSRAQEQDSRAAQAPLVEPYVMDTIYRYGNDTASSAPNGESKLLYGSIGDEVPSSLSALRGCPDDFLHRVIVRKLMAPINHYLYAPIHNFIYTTLLGRALAEEEQELSERTVGVIVSVLECTASAVCIAGTVTLLYNLKETRDRLIAASLLTVVFPLLVVFLSQEAMRIFMLTAAYWAVMVVYISTTDHTSNRASN